MIGERADSTHDEDVVAGPRHQEVAEAALAAKITSREGFSSIRPMRTPTGRKRRLHILALLRAPIGRVFHILV